MLHITIFHNFATIIYTFLFFYIFYGVIGITIMVFIFRKKPKNGSDMATNDHIFSYFHFGILILLPSTYAVRLGLGKK
jgi:hypothetical protein